MALFPDATFRLLLDDGALVAGRRANGALVIDVPRDIPRAERVQLTFRSVAWAGYGSGKNRSVVRRTMFFAPLHVDIPAERPLAKGQHRHPFAIDVPPWLPPRLTGPDCGIEHELKARLEVDWAVDPVAKLPVSVVLPARHGAREPLMTRSPAGFHDSIVLELTLASTQVAQDEPITGRVALRGGHDARFDAVELAVRSLVRVPMGRGDGRRGAGQMMRIPAALLRSGDPVPFEFPPNPLLPPTYATSFLDHDVVLEVSVDIPWARDPSFSLKLDVLPAGSRLAGDATLGLVGGDRLRRLALVVNRVSGLPEGRPPTLAEGAIGPVHVQVTDAPSEGRLGVDLAFTFPDVELGTTFRRLGVLDRLRASPLVPPALQKDYTLRCKPEDARPPLADEVLRSFFDALVGELAAADEVQLTDHHLRVHFRMDNDGSQHMAEVARLARTRAERIASAIRALPLPAAVSTARPAWEAAAAEHDAVLVPTGPSLRGVVLRARTLGGEERAMPVTVRTVWSEAGPSTHVDVDLQSSPVPKGALLALEEEAPAGASGSSAVSERLRAVRAAFPVVHLHAGGQSMTLEREGFTADPRDLVPVLTTLFDAVLEVRGERRVAGPYR